ncbi:hypothetical protein M0534_02515 [Methylonatrum kenyense]|uniref:tetratricopeptide repeat protein n=1 Tax=Methylonatrum kenyense TaxID=455253 RepID=UPI0020BE8C62|nr:hypothetical protein [Methylonatrum kenyense]MCK8515208.1 hypothetical protein [Methylonatrum kenyense]
MTTRRVSGLVVLPCIALLLSGCAATFNGPGSNQGSQRVNTASDLNNCDGALESDARVSLSAAREEMREGRFHAALAMLDEMDEQAVAVRYWRAEANRRLGRSEAKADYESLLGSCMDGIAHHGLGLFHMNHGDPAIGVDGLKQARHAHPSSSQVRNDYGYALLQQGETGQAIFELKTALELNPENERALSNLLLALLADDAMDEMAAVVNAYQVDSALVQRINSRLPALQEAWKSEPVIEEESEEETIGQRSTGPRTGQK